MPIPGLTGSQFSKSQILSPTFRERHVSKSLGEVESVKIVTGLVEQ